MAKPENQSTPHLTLKGYITGFVLSLGLTITAFLFVNEHTTSGHTQFSHGMLVGFLAVLALIQFAVQLVFFLHLGIERRPRWKLLVFWFMILIVLILVVGSIWIMQNLNYNMMSPEQMQLYMHEHQGF